MPRRYYDDAAHIIFAILLLLPIALLGVNLFSATVTAFFFGLIREVTEEGDPVSPESVLDALQSWRDLVGWTAGGLILGLFT